MSAEREHELKMEVYQLKKKLSEAESTPTFTVEVN